MENWKDVEGYEGLYEVSTEGRVRTKEGKVTHSSLHGERTWKQRVLKQKTDKLGYKRVTLWKNKSPKDFLVHRLVAIAFIDRVEGKEIINHKDCNVENNHVCNIEWCNHAENLQHAYENGLNKACNSIVLVHKETGEEHNFISMAKASLFMGRAHGYISSLVKRGKSETKDYYIRRVNE